MIRDCSLIVTAAADPAIARAVTEAAGAHPAQHFLLIAPDPATPNLQTLPEGPDLPTRLRDAVTASAKHS
ncbi:hypothetical protein AB0K51_01385 [Kitasatospora sp. NPDC049285]|uniref:hypothetical protein n=1 Tax=Kitasatospora sp. NPDC049285 TaxID=3157096 RepID=UPI00341F2FA1